MSSSTIVKLSELVGQHITDIKGLEQHSTFVDIFTLEGNHYSFSHEQECCEQVYLADFESDLEDYDNTFVISVDVVNSDANSRYEDLIAFWTFYKIQTNRGEIWLRFFRESNGYYSTTINFNKIIS